ncbi:phage envelope protein [Siphonobacter sp. BAB-5385]|uniref:DUF1398 domain-containing protein n=1 Tax=Siphonobacter sp. BAB-5385 TaxID=1864822 RepID=UPI000B9E5785|nr:DUF1398 family protein [Siphonobacter sp. BAB-5385]OZI06577.1 phage envelope protein [Siphonobacter sp. BAB-5385]
MFTLDQIHEIHSNVKSGADFPQYVQELKALGVNYYDLYVADGRAVYTGANGFQLSSEAQYPALPISEESSIDQLKHALLIHQQGQTDYLTFCQQAAQAGVEKWTTHMLDLTVVYYDPAGNPLVTEAIPAV